MQLDLAHVKFDVGTEVDPNTKLSNLIDSYMLNFYVLWVRHMKSLTFELGLCYLHVRCSGLMVTVLDSGSTVRVLGQDTLLS